MSLHIDGRDLVRWVKLPGVRNGMLEYGYEGEKKRLHCKFEVCETCGGRSNHVNPSIDAHGLTREDFDEDPDFAESYWSGGYDVQCYECKGERVVPVPDEHNNSKEAIAEYEAFMEAEWRMAREDYAERRAEALMMGDRIENW